MGRLFGYIRTTIESENVEQDRDQLKQQNVEAIFTDTIIQNGSDRPAYK